jgi:DNA mismatch repair protein MSH4
MTEQHDITIVLKYDPARQYYLRIPTSEFEETVPDILINLVRKKNTIECQTLPLMKMNQKIRDAHNEVISMSDKSVQELINAVRSKIHPLFKISESLAMLDMLAGMAQLVTTQDYVKPDLTSSTLALRSSRHPVRRPNSSPMTSIPLHNTASRLSPAQT